jgi:hypothetical protein
MWAITYTKAERLVEGFERTKVYKKRGALRSISKGLCAMIKVYLVDKLALFR